MTDFIIHTIESAPEASRSLLEANKKKFGIIGNMPSIMATSPQLLNAYQMLHKLFEETSFDAEELTVVWMTINVEHECDYCVPAHTAIARSMKVDLALIEALRNRTAMTSDKLQALHDFTLSVVRERGNVSEQDLQAFFSAGYKQQQVLEVLLGLSQKIISNYVNHVAHTPIDPIFAKFKWEK
ncbi:carboxymuconolactone decarboxylase family protein [Pseudoalteromonas sp. NGC95]|uniref:carboxymuconolactone decarboxylase family protein n=1 Tax=Pseudoalteromonas sp. NGC95 TaxID=2792051 RepID=UPI0018CD89F3|nr:carboxymuconolactone decarboxylase family protein [Pseudoalteromonas sp. NGC95]MBH0016307.1 carboxymuconolactone decarboxylase family protein [Pseudoalteromonas sp. NGC95]